MESEMEVVDRVLFNWSRYTLCAGKKTLAKAYGCHSFWPSCGQNKRNQPANIMTDNMDRIVYIEMVEECDDPPPLRPW